MRAHLESCDPRLFVSSVRVHPWVTAVIATLAMSVSYLDRQALSAIAPTVRKELDLSHAQFGWLASAFAIAYLVGAPISGRLVDRFGGRAVLAVAVVAWSAVAAGHAFALGFASMIVLRALLGVAEAPSFPAAAQTVRTVLPPTQRSAGFGLLFTGSSIGAMIAPPLAVRIAHDHGFRYAFVAIAVVGLAWLPLWLAFGPMRIREAAVERGAFLPLLKHPAIWRLAIVVGTSATAIGIVLNWYSQLLVEACGVDKDAVGHYLWLPPLVFDVAAISFGVLASRRDRLVTNGSHKVLMLVAGALTSTLVFVSLVHGPWRAVLLGSTTLAGGAGMYVLGLADVMRRVPQSSAATASGLGAAVQSIVGIIASPIVGRVVDHSHSWVGVVITVGAVALPGAVAWSIMRPDLSKPDPQH